MSKNYEDYTPINPMPPRRRKNSMLSFVQYSIVVLLVLALIVSGVLFMVLHKTSNHGDPSGNPILPPTTAVPDETEPPKVDEPETDEPETDPSDIPETGEPIEDEPSEPTFGGEEYGEITVQKSDVHKGDLILVSSNNPVVYPDQKDLVAFYGNKADSYQLSSANMLIHKDLIGIINAMMNDFSAEADKNDVIIWTSYRDEARQTQVYNDYVAQYGEEAAGKAVSKPGESDHHTALGIALRVYADGASYKLSEVEGYDWLMDNCYKYGFVERYPSDKIDLTGLDYSTSYYIRYVGVPHAEVMKKKNFCLEEYVIFLKNYQYGTAHFEFAAEDGTAYEIYYVSAAGEGDTVTVPVPQNGAYTISGDNMGGFIVTVQK
ncbi:MAG: M15 family metallopeptidase [Clostridia bacterium]|nr:D-alanyl-D-alanine carboxypeptidase family protein [Oscillospiraceae bacterium]MBQ6702952.1 M15 family metallopeptidase [Clostridia bacterium]